MNYVIVVTKMNFSKKYGKRKPSALDSSKILTYEEHFNSTFGGRPSGNRELYDDEVLNATDINWSSEINKEVMDFTHEEVEEAINKLGRGKAPGLDIIPAEAYKYGGFSIVEVLTKAFKQMRKRFITPSGWNKALVCLIYKNKGDTDNIANYRPISLTIVAKRIFELLIDKRLNEYKDKLHNYQAGFRPGRSTVDQLYCLQEIYEQNNREQKNTISVFLDLRAAYDCVDRNILWTKLRKDFKLSLGLIKLIRSLFDFNTSHILVDDVISKEGIRNERGVPQGSSLSPIMFNLISSQTYTSLRKTHFHQAVYFLRMMEIFMAQMKNKFRNS
jgi:hypothetical protein